MATREQDAIMKPLMAATESMDEARRKLEEAYRGKAAFDVVKDKSRAVRLQAMQDEIDGWLSEMDRIANPDEINT